MSLPTSQVKREVADVDTVVNDDTHKVEQPAKVFLSLAPATSAIYPTSQNYQPAPPAPRRSSSLGSDDSVKGLRFLKLGPVHYGEHPDENKGDFHEVAVE